MNSKIIEHYLKFSTYTFPGLYQDKLKNDLPDDIREIGLLVRKNFIHRTTLTDGNTGTNSDLKFGDMTKVPWWRQTEDDILPTTGAMLVELYHRDARGFMLDRKPENKLVLSCRYVAVMMASILKSKGIPARVRSGHASFFHMGDLGNVATDHWINQYWDREDDRWVTLDVDGSLSLNESFDPYDMPPNKFNFPADDWLNIRSGKIDPKYFHNGGGQQGQVVILWSLFYDFHSLMNSEILYTFGPVGASALNEESLKDFGEEKLSKIDNLAKLMQDPDRNFDELMNIWETQRDFRLLRGGLL